MVHAFATLEPRQNFSFFLLAVRRNEHRNGPADGFLGRVAEQALRAFVPTGDNAVEVYADNCVVRGIDNRSQCTDSSIGALPLGHIFDREENHLRRGVLQFQPPHDAAQRPAAGTARRRALSSIVRRPRFGNSCVTSKSSKKLCWGKISSSNIRNLGIFHCWLPKS